MYIILWFFKIVLKRHHMSYNLQANRFPGDHLIHSLAFKPDSIQSMSGTQIFQAQSVTRLKGEFSPKWSTKARLTKDKATGTRRPALKCKVGIWQVSPRQWWRPMRLHHSQTIRSDAEQDMEQTCQQGVSRGASPVPWRRKCLLSTLAKPTSACQDGRHSTFLPGLTKSHQLFLAPQEVD